MVNSVFSSVANTINETVFRGLKNVVEASRVERDSDKHDIYSVKKVLPSLERAESEELISLMTETATKELKKTNLSASDRFDYLHRAVDYLRPGLDLHRQLEQVQAWISLIRQQGEDLYEAKKASSKDHYGTDFDQPKFEAHSAFLTKSGVLEGWNNAIADMKAHTRRLLKEAKQGFASYFSDEQDQRFFNIWIPKILGLDNLNIQTAVGTMPVEPSC